MENLLPPAPRFRLGLELVCRYCGVKIVAPEPPEREKALYVLAFECSGCRQENRFGPPVEGLDVVCGDPVMAALAEVEARLAAN